MEIDDERSQQKLKWEKREGKERKENGVTQIESRENVCYLYIHNMLIYLDCLSISISIFRKKRFRLKPQTQYVHRTMCINTNVNIVYKYKYLVFPLVFYVWMFTLS